LGDRDALLTWETAMELNNEKFEVYKSVDQGQTFEQIGEVQGSGTTNELIEYGYVDLEAARDQEACYRLRQVDYDGAYEWTEMRCLSWASSSEVSVYPNPANDVIKVQVTKTRDIVKVELMDAAGKIVETREARGDEPIEMRTSDISQGVYFIRVHTGSQVETKRVVITH
ncbi:MAG: T9SS type A sorting domain-containing protein, partial [Bacteroidia bacterium]